MSFEELQWMMSPIFDSHVPAQTQGAGGRPLFETRQRANGRRGQKVVAVVAQMTAHLRPPR